jgi:hypothetical protein
MPVKPTLSLPRKLSRPVVGGGDLPSQPKPVKIYFHNTDVVKALGKKFKREVEEGLGDEIYLTTAYNIVARAFGYSHYTDICELEGYVQGSKKDRNVDADERDRRFEQYVTIISQNDFTRDEAEKMVSKISFAGWWGFSRFRDTDNDGADGTNLAAPPAWIIEASPIKMEFLNARVVNDFRDSLNRAIRRSGAYSCIGARKLTAKIFGYDTFAEIVECAGHGVPSATDWHVSPEELDRRVRAYIKVLRDAGIDERAAIQLLHSAGAGGWWRIERSEWQELRQERHIDRIEQRRGPRWRPSRTCSNQFSV